MKRFLLVLLVVLGVVWARNTVHTLSASNLVTRSANPDWSTYIDGDINDDNTFTSKSDVASYIYTKSIDFSHATGSAVLRIGYENDSGTLDFKVYAYYATVQNEDEPYMSDGTPGDGWAYKVLELGEVTSGSGGTGIEYNLLDYPELQAPLQRVYFKIQEVGVQANIYSISFTYVTEN